MDATTVTDTPAVAPTETDGQTSTPETPAEGSVADATKPYNEMTAEELMQTFTAEELRRINETGVYPEPKADAKADTDTEKDDVEKDEAGDRSGKPTEVADVVNDFKFTENADAETLAKEEAEYLENVELPAPLQAMLDRRDAAISEFTAKAADISAADVDETAKQHMEAFDKLVTFKQDADGTVVPDTGGVLTLLKDVYPNERRQLIHDLNSEPSEKYAGYTLFQEFIRDYANLDENGMHTVEQVLANGGSLPVPSFVPEGIRPEVAEAFWQSAERTAIQERLESSYELIRDEMATDAEKTQARADIQQINATLAQIQRGLDADKSRKAGEAEQQQQQKQRIADAGRQAYTETALQMLEITKGEIAKNLTSVFDEGGAAIVATGFATLIENALSDQDAFAKAAQDSLAKQGISFNWKAGREFLERLYVNENQIAALTAAKANPRAVDIKKNEKATILKELKGLEKELIGKIVTKVIGSSSKTLAVKVAAATKTAAVRPKAKGFASASPTTDWMAMSPAELESRMGEMKRELQSQGIDPDRIAAL